jgi:hypothetical protein
MAKSLTVLNKDLAQTLRLQALNQPPEALELTKLSSDIEKILQRPIIDILESERILNDYYNKLIKFMQLLKNIKQPQQKQNEVEDEILTAAKLEQEKLTPKTEQTPKTRQAQRKVETNAQKTAIQISKIKNTLEKNILDTLQHDNKSFNISPDNIEFKIDDKVFNQKQLDILISNMKKESFSPRQLNDPDIQTLYEKVKTAILRSSLPHTNKTIQKLPGLKKEIVESSPKRTTRRKEKTTIGHGVKKKKIKKFSNTSRIPNFIGKIHFKRWQQHLK